VRQLPSPPRAQRRRTRETGGEVRSGKNAIIGAARREESRRVQLPDREGGRRRRRRGKARAKRSVKDAAETETADWQKPLDGESHQP